MNIYRPDAFPQNVPREKCLCFTGHRPEKLPMGVVYRGMVRMLNHYIDLAVQKGYTRFFTGLADGIDCLAAEYLFTLRSEHPEIEVIGVQPCEDYRTFFQQRGYSVPRLEFMLANIDSLVILPGSFRDSSVFLKRNCYMVDHSAAIIAVCRDGRSGSMQALNYARKNQLAYCWIRLMPGCSDWQGTAISDLPWEVHEERF